MGGNFAKLEKTVLKLEEKIRKEDNPRNRYELKRIFRRKVSKLQAKIEKRKENAVLPRM